MDQKAFQPKIIGWFKCDRQNGRTAEEEEEEEEEEGEEEEEEASGKQEEYRFERWNFIA